MVSSKQVDLNVSTAGTIAIVIVAFSNSSNWVPRDIWCLPEGSGGQTDSLEVCLFDFFLPGDERIGLMNRLNKCKLDVIYISIPKVGLEVLHKLFSLPSH